MHCATVGWNGAMVCACICVAKGGIGVEFELSMPALPPLANCPARKGADNKLPPEAFRCRGG